MSAKGRRRSRRAKHRLHTVPPGTPPGTVISDPGAMDTVVHVVAYGPAEFAEKRVTSAQEIEPFIGKYPVLWVDVAGLRNAELILAIGELFNLHRLALEDVVHVHQRAKIEEYEGQTYIVARMAEPGEELDLEQLSMFIGGGHVITFQERPGGCLDVIRDRLRTKSGRIRNSGVDYLAYALMDLIVDCYFPVLERYDEALEELEDQILTKPRFDTIARLYAIKHDLLLIRRAMWPMREAVGTLMRESARFVKPETRIYLRDLYDHMVQILELTEVYRDVVASLMDVHLSAVSTRMNEVIKVLTIITTVFMPLSFIAGIYGMNFDPESSPWNMPELRWEYGYLFALGLMLVIAVGMVLIFWWRGWFHPAFSAPHARSREAKLLEQHVRLRADSEASNAPR